MKKPLIITILIIVIYLAIGTVVMFLGGITRDLTILEHIINWITVAVGWPFFLLMRLF